MNNEKFYLQTWFIAMCFALWPLYLIPLIVGVILLYMRGKEDAKCKSEISQLKNDFDSLKQKYESIGAHEYFEVKQKCDSMNAELESKIESTNKEIEDKLASLALEIDSYNSEIASNNNIISRLREEISSLKERDDKLSKQINASTKKLSKIKEIYNGISHTIDTFYNIQPAFNDLKLPEITLSEIEMFSPTIFTKLHCMDIKDLRKAYRENDKQISQILEQYSARYTTKANQAIYQLMVIALRAELQNILCNLKYEKLDTAIDQVKSMTSKYLKIAGDGNQSIAGTLTKFIGEVEYFFINSVKIEYNYYVKREQAKQEQLALREHMKQEAEERKALEAEKKKIENEEAKYNSEISKLQDTLSSITDSSELDALNKRILELQAQLSDVLIKKEEITSLQNGKAGTVYIISNLGSFGEDIFKIGMTRRLEPQDRINELGSASVPFKFDVHSFIFSDDAVSLENKLHQTLNNKRLNKVNIRKEFFRVSLDELEKIVDDIDSTAEFNRTMLAEEFRQSLSSDDVYSSDYISNDDEEEDEE